MSATTATDEAYESTRPRLLTLEEVAERMRVPIGTLRHLRTTRRFAPAIKVGRRVVWDVVDVDTWLDAQREST